MQNYRLVFVIPAFNEEVSIGNIVASLQSKGQVIVVDDCSTDNTASVAKSFGAKVITHKQNMGYSKALNSGFDMAFNELKADGVISLDADGEHSIESVDKIIYYLTKESAPLVLGIRSKKNRLIEYIIGYFIKSKYGISDIFCGMKGYQSIIFKKKNIFDENNTVGTELVIGCVKGNVQFKEVEIKTNKRKGKSRFGVGIKGSFYLLKGILRALKVEPINIGVS